MLSEKKPHAITRIDTAHARPLDAGIDLAQTAGVMEAVAGRGAMGSEQLQRQAEQIRGQLLSQQQDLDSREAEFNARLARMENEARTARLLQTQREQEIVERETTFQQRWDALQRRAKDVSLAYVDGQFVSLDENDRAASDDSPRQQDIALRDPGFGQDLDRAADMWERRLSELEVSEQQLNDQIDELHAIRERLELERKDVYEQQASHDQQFQSQKSNFEQHRENELRLIQEKSATLDAKSATLEDESVKLEQRRLSLKQVHADVTQMYREALEMRICCEEVWGRVSGSVSPEVLTQRLAEMRRKLAGQFQLANQSLANQRAELTQLVERLDDHRGQISEERENMELWLGRRHAELDEQAARLANREKELDVQRLECEELKQSWGNEHGKHTDQVNGFQLGLESSHLPLGESCSVS